MNEDFFEALEEMFDKGNAYVEALVGDRPFDGQAHTDQGERGRQEVKGVSYRDLRDAYVIACFQASGLEPKDYPKTIYELPWDQMDPGAVASNMVCEVERRQGVYPNVDSVKNADAKRLRSVLERVLMLLQAMTLEGDQARLREAAEVLIYEAK